MTKSSKNRAERKGNQKAAGFKAPEEITPEAVVRFTELKGGGFTVGLGLHGARVAALFGDAPSRASIVDVMALAVSHLIRSESEELRKAIARTANVLKIVENATQEGKSVPETIAEVEAPGHEALNKKVEALTAAQA